MKKYTLIITEKPDAAKRIAYALDYKGKPEHLKKNGIPYFVAFRNRQLVIVPAIGHLYTIIQEKGKHNFYPVINFKWTPRYLTERKAKYIRNWIEIFSQLSTNADEFISACDYDIEGSLIGYCILKFACNNKEFLAKRMKFSTLMESELKNAYEEPIPHLNFSLIDAGKTRHEIDWLYGINLSRALTLAALRRSGKYFTLSTGRVQGPTLQFVYIREKAIRSFVPIPFWEIRAEVKILNSVIEANYERKRIETRAEADAVVLACANKTGKCKKLDMKKVYCKPPLPFDISTLQCEAYKFFGYTPRFTLKISQQLYLDALISYPRTNSQKLPSIIDYRKIIHSFKNQSGYKRLASKLLKKQILKPREGAKEDSAHPAIYPTGNLPEKPLDSHEKKIFDLIIRRFMAVFGEDALMEKLKVHLEVNNYGFFIRGLRILKEGWIEYYKPYVRTKEVILPIIKEGDIFQFKHIIREDKFTSPPSRYNPSSLLKKMEKFGIGTKATRADIIQTLYDRGYIKEKQIMITELGFSVIEILGMFAAFVVSAQLTQEIEYKVERIKRSEIKRVTVLAEVIEQLKPQLERLKENEDFIGETLTKAIDKLQTKERVVGKCPTCITGNLIIIYSRTTRKRFIGCTNYFKGWCETSFPLPQQGTIKVTKSKCRTCGWPLILVWSRSRRSWNLCFNPSCSFKK